jgi:DNA-binding GntR family transcriptional regulator
MPNSKAIAARATGNRRKNATAPRGRRAVASAEVVFERVVEAIQSHRLAPGTRLVEEKLGAYFGVSRTIVRQGLAKLAQAGLVELSHNQGARIAWPDAKRTADVFDARRLIEIELVARVAAKASAADVAKLRAHLRTEDAARKRGDRIGLVRLTGEFHLKLAEMADNVILARTLSEYETVTCLAILAHDRTGESACPPDEHALIVDAIEARDARGAAALMRRHLDHVLAGLDLDAVPREADPLEAALAPRPATPRRRPRGR